MMHGFLAKPSNTLICWLLKVLSAKTFSMELYDNVLRDRQLTTSLLRDNCGRKTLLSFIAPGVTSFK